MQEKLTGWHAVSHYLIDVLVVREVLGIMEQVGIMGDGWD